MDVLVAMSGWLPAQIPGDILERAGSCRRRVRRAPSITQLERFVDARRIRSIGTVALRPNVGVRPGRGSIASTHNDAVAGSPVASSGATIV